MGLHLYLRSWLPLFLCSNQGLHSLKPTLVLWPSLEGCVDQAIERPEQNLQALMHEVN